MPSEHTRHMAMLRAALPYIMPGRRHAVEVLLQADSLMRTARGEQAIDDFGLEASELPENTTTFHNSPFQSEHSSTENMLLCIQEYCTPKEADLIHTILNVFQASRLFQKYQEFQKNFEQKATSDLEAKHVSTPNNHLMEFLISSLSPEQKTAFEQFQKILYNDRCQAPERTDYDSRDELAQ